METNWFEITRLAYRANYDAYCAVIMDAGATPDPFVEWDELPEAIRIGQVVMVKTAVDAHLKATMS